MIGVLHGSSIERPRFSIGSRYFAALMDGIVDGAFEKGYSVTLCPKLLGEDQAEGIADGRFDGLIWYQRRDTEEDLVTAASCPLPIVFVHSSLGSTGTIWPSVSCDNEQGTLLAVKHLVELGHKKIAFVIEPWFQNGEGVTRALAFNRAMDQFGLEGRTFAFRPDLPDHPTILEQGFTAALAWNDETAGTLINRLQANGAVLPRDLSVIGFDSTSYCDEITPKLTSIRQPLIDIGRSASQLLISQISGDHIGTDPVLHPCVLDVRESTCPAKT